MMGGGMMGGGMMGQRMMQMLGLTDKQRSSIRGIHRELHKKTWSLMGKMIDARYSLHDLYASDKKDARAIGRAYDRIFAIKRQIIVARIQAANKMRDVLTSKQRAQLKRMRRMMWRGDMGWTRGDRRNRDRKNYDRRKGSSGHMPGMMGN
jgi:Spy/CpxP family protein refolding chaperone